MNPRSLPSIRGRRRYQVLSHAALILVLLILEPACAVEMPVLWQQVYDGPGSGADSGRAVAANADGFVAVTGISSNVSHDDDFYTAKYAPDGALLWEKIYNGVANGNDGGNAVAIDAAGNVTATGWTDTNGVGYDPYTVKYRSSDGAVLWEQRYNGTGNNYSQAVAIALDSSGNAIVTGPSVNDVGKYDYYIAKYDATDGHKLWDFRQDGTAAGNDVPSSLVVDANDDVIVTGQSPGSASGELDYFTTKLGRDDGIPIWAARARNGPTGYASNATSIAVDPSGNVAVTGYGGPDILTVKYAAANGAVLWSKLYNGPANGSDSGTGVAMDASGNVYVTGSSSNGPSSDYVTLKYAASNGDLLWESRYDFASDSPTQIALNAAGNVVVTGQSAGDFFTAVYSGSDGLMLYSARTDGASHGLDGPTTPACMALLPSGYPVVTGWSTPTPGTTNIMTVAYGLALPDAPTVQTFAASSVTRTAAVLHGAVNPHGLSTTALFDYGPTTAYGSTVDLPLSSADGMESQTVSAALSGLASHTTYHFRVRASNSGGDSESDDLIFTTGEGSPNLLVSSINTHSILRFDGVTGAFKDHFIAPGAGGLDSPYGIEAGPDGELYVGDRNRKVVMRFGLHDGSFLGNFTENTVPAVFPASLHFGRDGNLYLVNHSSHTDIRKYNILTGQFIAIVAQGSSNRIGSPTDFIITSNGFVLSVSSLQRCSRFYPLGNGAWIDYFINPTGNLSVMNNPRAIVMGTDGNYWVTNAGLNSITRYSPSTGVKISDIAAGAPLNSPYAMLIDGNRLLVSNTGSNEILMYPIVDPAAATLGTPQVFVGAGAGLNSPQYMTMAYVSDPPLAQAGTDFSVPGGEPFLLNGTGSSDPDGEAIGFAWTQLSGLPVFSNSPVTNATVPLTAPFTSGSAVFQLQVTDESGKFSTDTISVSVVQPLDTDSNGLPDRWEEHYSALAGGADDDDDHDGTNNRFEFLTGTDPTDPASYFRLEEYTLLPAGMRLRFRSGIGRNYEVQHSTDLKNWQVMPGFETIGGTGASIEVTPPAEPGFYRVATKADY